MLNARELELGALNQNIVEVGEDKGPILLYLINKFTHQYSDLIEGKFVKDSSIECLGGSRINFIFHEIFVKAINGINPLEFLSDQDIQTAIKNA
mmetsp:Transcript_1246/g.1281  ORF Transcript_1246/g.1281 Transcript_1246/m.1281 type:complete len:94 (+) Transcript_1246:943-1224(+)